MAMLLIKLIFSVSVIMRVWVSVRMPMGMTVMIMSALFRMKSFH